MRAGEEPAGIRERDAGAGADFFHVERSERNIRRGLGRPLGVTGDEVHDAADRVGSEERRGGAFDDFNPLELIDWLAIEIHGAALDAAGANHRLAINQYRRLT